MSALSKTLGSPINKWRKRKVCPHREKWTKKPNTFLKENERDEAFSLKALSPWAVLYSCRNFVIVMRRRTVLHVDYIIISDHESATVSTYFEKYWKLASDLWLLVTPPSLGTFLLCFVCFFLWRELCKNILIFCRVFNTRRNRYYAELSGACKGIF